MTTRRQVLAMSAATAAGVILPEVAGGASAAAMPQQYMVGGSRRAVDWRWPDNEPLWTMSSKDGVAWYSDGPLTAEGRRMLLEHFGLDVLGDSLPVESIRTMSPSQLAGVRSRLERELGIERIVIESDRVGGHISAALAA